MILVILVLTTSSIVHYHIFLLKIHEFEVQFHESKHASLASNPSHTILLIQQKIKTCVVLGITKKVSLP